MDYLTLVQFMQALRMVLDIIIVWILIYYIIKIVRGHQVDATQQRNIYIANEAYRIDTLIVMPIVALPILAVCMLYVMFAPVKKESLGEDLLWGIQE